MAFNAGHLQPGTLVWGRWVDRTYHRGIISEVNTQVHIKFNDGDTISHSAQDLTAVVADVNPGYLDRGTRVIAQWKNKARYYPGHVEGNANSSFYIHFDDGDRGWARRDQIRVFSQTAPAGYLSQGIPVWGRWVDRTWHRGRISNINTEVHIKFNDGDTISHDVHDQNAVVADVIPSPGVVQVGTRVIAQWRDKARYYPGRVVGHDNEADPRFPRYDIQFDDGDRGWAKLNQLHVLPKITTSVGSRVYGRWTNGLYHPGKVERVDTKIHIRFDDGDRISHFPIDADAVVRDVIPHRGAVVIGSRVIAFWPHRVPFYPGNVTCVDKQNPHHFRYFVHYDDGDERFVTVDQLRLVYEPAPPTAKHYEEIVEKVKKAVDKFVGLTGVKDQFMRFAKTQIFYERMRQVDQRDETPYPLHLIFAGNPGTGKTCFARCVAELLCSIGKIKENKVVEVQRSDLVGQYIGHTAKHTKKKIEEARGGVLFIDEAYRLLGSSEDFGKEAIEELMSEMEKGDPVMIFAGYEEMMAKFLKVNMGMKSRITHKFVFPDYTVKELAAIFRQRAQEKKFTLNTKANVESVIEKCTSKEQRATMNARLMRKLLLGSIEEAIIRLPFNAPEREDFEIKEIDIEEAAKRLSGLELEDM